MVDHEGPRQSLLSCVRKRRYVTVAYAGEVRAFMERSFPESRFNVYFCAFCRGYHVGRAWSSEPSNGPTNGPTNGPVASTEASTEANAEQQTERRRNDHETQ